MNSNYNFVMKSIARKLNDYCFINNTLKNYKFKNFKGIAAVIFLLGPGHHNLSKLEEPNIILSKRSNIVNHPGELCCPGGRVRPKLDFAISKILKLPLIFLSGRITWSKIIQSRNNNFILLLSTALRECFEEIRLNPFKIKLLGILPIQQMKLSTYKICPIVCCLTKQTKFSLNQEVNKIIRIPLSSLLARENYSIYRVKRLSNKFPCFIHRYNGSKEILWGVTYRITVTFLKLAYGYHNAYHHN